MAPSILLIVHRTQEILRKATINSVVTGDLAFSYHGVDVATHVCHADLAEIMLYH